MNDDMRCALYDQLNQRSRWYSSQLWYVPFAYLGIVGFAVEKVPSLPEVLRSPSYFMLALFSLAVFVHVGALKYYERRAVRSMQNREDPVESGGGSPWYMSFTSYMKFMLATGTLAFAWTGVSELKVLENQRPVLRIMVLIVLLFVMGAVWRKDFLRNRPVLKEIRDKPRQISSHHSSMGNHA